MLRSTPYCQYHHSDYSRFAHGTCYRWVCQRKGHPIDRISVREGSYFEGSHISISTTIRLIYCWAFDLYKDSDFIREMNLSEMTIIDFKNSLRDVCAHFFIQNPPLIGGPDHTVEIDESLFGPQKVQCRPSREGAVGFWRVGQRRQSQVFIASRTTGRSNSHPANSNIHSLWQHHSLRYVESIQFYLNIATRI